ncbi:MAG: BamA/TamA family outer membrane protein [Oligoflexales bacterium]
MVQEKLKLLFLVVAVFLHNSFLFAKTIESINIVGLNRTQRFVVERELLVNIGKPYTYKQIEESCQRLRNLQVFATAECVLTPGQSPQVSILTITVDERWTTIPIFKYSSGGGATQLIIGSYDINVFGRYLELGGQYERIRDKNSGVLWYRNRRFLGKRLELFLNLWSVARERTLYNIWGKENSVEGGYMLLRKRGVVFLEKEWTWWLKTGIGLQINHDEFTSDFSPNVDEVADYQGMPENANILLVNFKAKLGRLDYNSYLIDGLEMSSNFEISSKGLGSDLQFFRLEEELKWFKSLPFRSTIGARVGLGISTVNSEPYMYYLGGLDRIRGFKESRFRAKNYWMNNFEYRIPSWKSRWFVLQHIFFYDSIGIALSDHDLAEQSAASLGMGLRVISPKIYRLVLRIDYAKPIHKDDENPISFGVQQFF